MRATVGLILAVVVGLFLPLAGQPLTIEAVQVDVEQDVLRVLGRNLSRTAVFDGEVTLFLPSAGTLLLPVVFFDPSGSVQELQAGLPEDVEEDPGAYLLTVSRFGPAQKPKDTFVVSIGSPGPVGSPGPTGPAGPRGTAGAGLNPLRVATLRWYEANQVGPDHATACSGGAVTFDGLALWITCGDQQVRRIRPGDGAILGVFSAEVGSPQGLVFDGTHVWVLGHSSISQFRATDGELLEVVPVGSDPRKMLFDGSSLWVTDAGQDFVIKIRASDGTRLGTFPMVAAGITFDGSAIWVNDFEGDTISKMRPGDGALLGTFPVGDGPGDLAYDGTHIWVTYPLRDRISRVRASDGMLLDTFLVGDRPRRMMFDGRDLWVSNYSDATVSKLRVTDGVLLGTFEVGDRPFQMAFDGRDVWVAGFDLLSKR